MSIFNDKLVNEKPRPGFRSKTIESLIRDPQHGLGLIIPDGGDWRMVPKEDKNFVKDDLELYSLRFLYGTVSHDLLSPSSFNQGSLYTFAS